MTKIKQKTLLIITDGIGHSENDHYNAFKAANTPTYDRLFKEVPHSLISTHGMHVGLPDGQMGNSEVGHMCLGSGQVLYQDLVKISRALKDGSLAKNEHLNHFLESTNHIHLMGLVSDGGVHSHIDHFIGMIDIILSLHPQKTIFLHLITDGRDVLPQSAKDYISTILKRCNSHIHIATISGRFYAMDRDKRWERVKEAHAAIENGANQSKLDILSYIDSSYKEGIFDEFIKPASFEGYKGLCENDGVIFINFRSDRAREIIMALNGETLEIPTHKIPKILTMTPYDKTFTHPILFPKEDVKNTLAEVISSHNLTQAHIAETEKYAHVTFFFNGGIEEPFLGEMRALIPSPQCKTYDECPQMSAFAIKDSVLKFMQEGCDFIVVNFANGDMVGHTGNFKAAIKAVEAVDSCLCELFDQAKKLDYGVILTSDHGNCEEMRNDKGEILTNHTIGDVWCFIMANEVEKIDSGNLSNIAASVLKIMGLDIPDTMQKPLF